MPRKGTYVTQDTEVVSCPRKGARCTFGGKASKEKGERIPIRVHTAMVRIRDFMCLQFTNMR